MAYTFHLGEARGVLHTLHHDDISCDNMSNASERATQGANGEK